MEEELGLPELTEVKIKIDVAEEPPLSSCSAELWTHVQEDNQRLHTQAPGPPVHTDSGASPFQPATFPPKFIKRFSEKTSRKRKTQLAAARAARAAQKRRNNQEKVSTCPGYTMSGAVTCEKTSTCVSNQESKTSTSSSSTGSVKSDSVTCEQASCTVSDQKKSETAAKRSTQQATGPVRYIKLPTSTNSVSVVQPNPLLHVTPNFCGTQGAKTHDPEITGIQPSDSENNASLGKHSKPGRVITAGQIHA